MFPEWSVWRPKGLPVPGMVSLVTGQTGGHGGVSTSRTVFPVPVQIVQNDGLRISIAKYEVGDTCGFLV